MYDRLKTWVVDIDVIGPVSVTYKEEPISFKQEKGFKENRFYSDIIISNRDNGITIKSTANANTGHNAYIVSFVFIGQMLDVLIFDNEIPLTMQSISGKTSYSHKNFDLSIRRVLNKNNFIAAFNVCDSLQRDHPMLLKAMGWYAKGMNSNNTMDSFLSFWNALEITACKYHTETERTKLGVINKIYQSFLDYLGEPEEWNLRDLWLNDMSDFRVNIAHGVFDTTAKSIIQISENVPDLSRTSKRLITEVLKKVYTVDIFAREDWNAKF